MFLSLSFSGLGGRVVKSRDLEADGLCGRGFESGSGQHFCVLFFFNSG